MPILSASSLIVADAIMSPAVILTHRTVFGSQASEWFKCLSHWQSPRTLLCLA